MLDVNNKNLKNGILLTGKSIKVKIDNIKKNKGEKGSIVNKHTTQIITNLLIFKSHCREQR